MRDGGQTSASRSPAPRYSVGDRYDHRFSARTARLSDTDAKSWFDGDEEGRKEGAFRNSSLQGAYLMLAARAIGLDCGPMSGFDADAVNAAFFAENPRHRANFICAIGYGDTDSIFDRSPRPDFMTFNRIA